LPDRPPRRWSGRPAPAATAIFTKRCCDGGIDWLSAKAQAEARVLTWRRSPPRPRTPSFTPSWLPTADSGSTMEIHEALAGGFQLSAAQEPGEGWTWVTGNRLSTRMGRRRTSNYMVDEDYLHFFGVGPDNSPTPGTICTSKAGRTDSSWSTFPSPAPAPCLGLPSLSWHSGVVAVFEDSYAGQEAERIPGSKHVK